MSSVEEFVNIGRAIGGITAGERDGKIAEGLAYGNSPFEYPRDFVENKTLVLTTTNGTKLLHMAKDAIQIITGSFPNISAVCEYLISQNQNVILGCAAWKDRINMEDTLFAGAVVSRIKQHFDVNCDSAIAAETLYESAKHDIYTFMKQASHYQRLARYGLEKDIHYCLTPDGANVLPLFRDGELIAG